MRLPAAAANNGRDTFDKFRVYAFAISPLSGQRTENPALVSVSMSSPGNLKQVFDTAWDQTESAWRWGAAKVPGGGKT